MPPWSWAGIPLWDERASRAPVTLRDETVSRPGCGPVLKTPVEFSDHIVEGPIVYSATAPGAGDHRNRWAYYSRNFYEVADRPEVGELVHNLEHGYNVLWYDETVLEDAGRLDALRALADSYDGAKRDPAIALIADPPRTRRLPREHVTGSRPSPAGSVGRGSRSVGVGRVTG